LFNIVIIDGRKVIDRTLHRHRRSRNVKAKDLMHPLTDYLRPEQPLKEAVVLLKTVRRGEENICVRALPVLDAKRHLVGMISMGDILKAIWPSYMSMMNLGDFTWDGMVEHIAQRMKDAPVGSLMTKEVITVPEEAHLMECVDHMIKFNVKKLPVLDLSGAVTGMLYERDVFFAIVKAMMNGVAGGLA
jgi:CBS-domain-containing membrane protein